MRNAIGLQQQWYRFYIDGYAMNDSIEYQDLHLSTFQGQFRLNTHWTLLGGISYSNTILQYPTTQTALEGWGNLNIGARYTHRTIIREHEHFLVGEGRFFAPLPNSEFGDPLNLASTPFGSNLSGAWLMRHRSWQFAASTTYRMHTTRGILQMGSSWNTEVLAAKTVRERNRYKVQLQSSLAQFLQHPDIEDVRTGITNTYSGGVMTSANVGIGLYLENASVNVIAGVPVVQDLGRGTSELAPNLRVQLKYSW
ncbi:MAG: hypothetical protein RL754_1224 [Bacteroidota bacterium]